MKNLMNKIRKANKGFTLVELIIVVAIIAVLSAVLVPQYIQYVEKSRIGADESYISEIGHNVQIVAATDHKVNNKKVVIDMTTAGASLMPAMPAPPQEAGSGPITACRSVGRFTIGI